MPLLLLCFLLASLPLRASATPTKITVCDCDDKGLNTRWDYPAAGDVGQISLRETAQCWSVTAFDGCAWAGAKYSCIELIDSQDCAQSGTLWNATLGKSGTGTVIFRDVAQPQFCADFNADFDVLELYPCVRVWPRWPATRARALP